MKSITVLELSLSYCTCYVSKHLGSTPNNMKSNVRQHETKLVDSEVVSHLPQYVTSHPGKSMLSLRAKKIQFT